MEAISEKDRTDLKALEESLWTASSRYDRDHMERVLAMDFFEFGRSGKRYAREEIVAAAPREFRARLPLENFSAQALSADLVLITYVSEVAGETVERANRASIWSRTAAGWRLRFHQGTPTSLRAAASPW